MTNFVPSISVDQVIDAAASYIALFTSVEIIRGNVNRTPMPKSSFIALTEISTQAINKPTENYADYTATLNEHNRIDIRVDFYGWDLAEVARAIHSSFRTIWSVDRFPSNVKPLLCTEPRKVNIINAEEQYEQRWYMDMALQYNPDVVVPQDTFNTLGEHSVVPADVIY